MEDGDWFLLDKSGEFSLDTTVMATIWLVGGGMDGTDGFTDNQGFFHGGIGGQGGNVYKFGKVKLSKNQNYAVIIAGANEPSGTSFKLGETLFSSGQAGHTCVYGGAGGIINPTGGIVNPIYGKDGIDTPYGYVGSSGGGGVCAAIAGDFQMTTGMSKGGAGAGNSREYIVAGMSWDNLKDSNPNIDGVNYGCGGGGNTYCRGLRDIGVKSRGMNGCVIIQYAVLDGADDTDGATIRYWNKNSSENFDSAVMREEINALSQRLKNTENQNDELRNRISELEKRISEMT